MLFRVVSDIHLEHWLSGTYTDSDVEVWMSKAVPPIATDKDSILFLCGDISPYWPQRRHMMYAVAKRFKEVVYLAGNHEHWGGRLDDWNPEAKSLEALFSNVHVGESGTAKGFTDHTSKTIIIYATMWAPYGRDNPVYEVALAGNADCRQTQADASSRKCVPKDFQELYTAELTRIEHELKMAHKVGYSAVVATHHVPGLRLRLPGLQADPFDDMFMSPHAECFMHEEWAPKYWFFGHTHQAWDIQIGKTRCISNPFGYPGETYRGWLPAKVV